MKILAAMPVLLLLGCGNSAPPPPDGAPVGDLAPQDDAHPNDLDLGLDSPTPDGQLDAAPTDLASADGVKDARPAHPWLFVLAGQSNMLGLGRLYPWLAQASFAQIPSHVEFYLGDERFTSFAGQRDKNSDGIDEFGPELALIAELTRRYPQQKLIVIKLAVGNTSMDRWLPSYLQNDGTEQKSTDSLYARLRQLIELHVAQRDVEAKAVLWMQGESDAIDGPYALVGQRHRENLQRLIALFRQDLGAPQLPFIFGKIYRYEAVVNSAVSDQAQFDAVRAAQEQVATADANVHLIDTDHFLLNDVWHFNGTSQLALGSCYAQVFSQRPSRYECPLQSGYDEAPIVIYSSTPDGPAGHAFASDQTIYGRALEAGSDATNLTACLENGGTDYSCNDASSWTSSAPWTYDGPAGVWRNGGTSFPTGIYRGYWGFQNPARRGFATGFTVY